MMKKFVLGLICIFILCSHDMYLKMDSYFIGSNQDAIIDLYNGTFEKSENVIDRDRMLDASLIGNGDRIKIQDTQWIEKDSITKLRFKSGEAGTWVAGVSTKPRNIEMEAKDFNNYLEHDGVKDMLQQRTDNNTLNTNAVEKYSKHVKTIFQVGDERTSDWQTDLGYPIEFIPLSNPYDAHTGDTLQVKLLRDGKPLANQLVYADFKPSKHGHSHGDTKHSHENSKETHTHADADATHTHGDATHTHSGENSSEEPEHEHSHDGDKEKETHTHDNADATHTHGDTTHTHSDENSSEEPLHEHFHDADEQDKTHTHTTGQELRTNEKGIVEVNLTDDGIWYLRTIHLVTSEEEGLTHESNWATLTFEISHSHDHTDATHELEHEDGFPSYIFWILSIVVIAGLFFFFSRKTKK